MSNLPINNASDCREWILRGCKPRSEFRVGTEFERLLIAPSSTPLGYEGTPGIKATLEDLQRRLGWAEMLERDNLIGLVGEGASVTLEPAGQFELSGAPLRSITEMRDLLHKHLQVDAVLSPHGVRPLYVGINPLQRPGDAPRMPKARYDIMRRWMPTVGERGLDMMHLTCTVQANLDFSDPADAMELMRAGFLVTPVLIALFANSPWRYGVDTGMASARADLWLDVDPGRCDLGAIAFDPTATVDDYVQWAFDVPMYFIPHADDAGVTTYRSPERQGATFRDFVLYGDRGRGPTEKDWELHLSTLFPDVRLKRFVELRAADVVPPAWLPAFPALCVSLLTDTTARAQLLDLFRDGDAAVDRAALRDAACQRGLEGTSGGFQLRELAGECLRIARDGAVRRSQTWGVDEAADEGLDRLQALVDGEYEPFYTRQRRALAAGTTMWELAETLS